MKLLVMSFLPLALTLLFTGVAVWLADHRWKIFLRFRHHTGFRPEVFRLLFTGAMFLVFLTGFLLALSLKASQLALSLVIGSLGGLWFTGIVRMSLPEKNR